MVRIFCLKHQIELEADSHSGASYCSECDRYPYVHETYEVLEPNEVLYRHPNGHAEVYTLDALPEIPKEDHDFIGIAKEVGKE
jgi:hypothetical protein